MSSARDESENFNVIVQVIKKKAQGKIELLKVRDHSEKGYIELSENMIEEYSYIKPKDFIYVQNAIYTDVIKRRIDLKGSGYIAKVPKYAKILKEYKSIMNIFIEGATLEMLIDEKDSKFPNIISSIKVLLPVTSFKSITDNNINLERYRLNVYVIEMGPKNIKDWVKSYCPKCKVINPLTIDDDEEEIKCKSCEGNSKMIYQVQLFVKDENERSKPEAYRVLLLTDWTNL